MAKGNYKYNKNFSTSYHWLSMIPWLCIDELTEDKAICFVEVKSNASSTQGIYKIKDTSKFKDYNNS